MRWLIRPHHTSLLTEGSSTTNLSRDERPVCAPVETSNDPSADNRPSSRRNASATRAGAERLAGTGRHAGTPVPLNASSALVLEVERVAADGIIAMVTGP